MSPFLQLVAASCVGAFVSMAVAFLVTFRLSGAWIMRLVSFSAGLMLSIALLDLLPDALAHGMTPNHLFSMLLAGIIGFFVIEKTFVSHAHAPGMASDHLRPVPMVLIGGALHVFSDGLILGAIFLTDIGLGWATALAVLAHEIPREAGDFALLTSAGWRRAKALAWNALSRTACIAGAVAAYWALDGARDWLPVILTLAAANFVYIALTGILPWVMRQKGGFSWHAGLMAFGMVIVPLGAKFIH